jgi:predicted RecA/RadA family phage recombinase
MAIIDAQGRLFGKVSLLDLGAGMVIGLVLGGIFLLPGKTGKGVVKGNADGKAIEVDVIVKGLNALDGKGLVKPTDKVNVVIRNEPSGAAEIKSVEFLPRNLAVPQPDGSVKALPDPRPEGRFSNDILMTLSGNAQVTEDGVVFGNKKVKIGTTLELEGKEYNFNSTVIAIRR